MWRDSPDTCVHKPSCRTTNTCALQSLQWLPEPNWKASVCTLADKHLHYLSLGAESARMPLRSDAFNGCLPLFHASGAIGTFDRAPGLMCASAAMHACGAFTRLQNRDLIVCDRDVHHLVCVHNEFVQECRPPGSLLSGMTAGCVVVVGACTYTGRGVHCACGEQGLPR